MFYSLQSCFSSPRGSAYLFLACNSLLAALAGTGVGTRALTTDRKSAAVASALVVADFDLASNVGSNATTEVTLCFVIALEVVTQRDELVVGEFVNTEIATDFSGCEGFSGAGFPDTEYVCECDLEALFARQVDTK